MKEDLSKHIGNKIRKYRKSLKMTQEDLANKLGTTKQTISNYESAYRKPQQDDLFSLAEVFGISIDDLFPYRDDLVNLDQVPVVSFVSAGQPIYAEEDIIEHIYVSDAKPGTFGLKIHGDSMDKEFKHGDIVVVEKNATVENGQIGVVIVNGYNGTVKRIKYDNDKIILIPESNNTEHLPQVYTDSDEVTIVGRVVAAYKKY